MPRDDAEAVAKRLEDTPIVPCSFESLLYLLGGSLTKDGVLAICRLVQASLPVLALEEAMVVLKLTIRAQGQLSLLAMLAPVLNLFFQHMNQAILSGGISAEEVQRYYAWIIFSLREFAGTRKDGKRSKLPSIIQDEVTRTFTHMVDALRALPSSSTDSTPPLTKKLLSAITAGNCLTTRLAKLVVEYQQSAGAELGRAFIQRCFMAALSEGAYEMAARYHDMRNSSTNNHIPSPTPSGSLEAPDQNSEQIFNVLSVARAAHDFPDFVRSLKPFLHPAATSREDHDVQLLISQYAWSILITQTGKRQNATPKQIIDLYDHMPDAAVCAHTIAPTMQALWDLGHAMTAWKIWEDAVKMQRESGQPGRYIDQAVIGIATGLAGALNGTAAAVELVDAFGSRAMPDEQGQSTLRYKLDPKNINTLLRQCSRSKHPSVAFRLWYGAEARYGINLDQWSLGTLLESARNCEFMRHVDDSPDDLQARFRSLMGEFRIRAPRGSPQDLFALKRDSRQDALQFGAGTYHVLLDPPGYKWYHETHSRPWKRARHVFRDVVLTNWPFLHQVTSPLDLQSGPFGFASVFGGSVKSTSTTDHSTILPSSPHYAHLVPAPPTWHAYIRLLGTFNQVEEIPLALAWMKELNIKPRRKTLLDALMFVSEVEGPRRRVKGMKTDGGSKMMRDEQLLRAWLTDWLGEGETMDRGAMRSIVPDEDEVVDLRTMIMGKGQKLIL